MLIIDMPMPNNCSECPLAQFDYGRFCGWVVHCGNGMKSVEREIADNGRPDWCPIKGVLPEQHGRLGDLDELAAGCDEPTVDAVPVEWIKNHIREQVECDNITYAMKIKAMLDWYMLKCADGERKKEQYMQYEEEI